MEPIPPASQEENNNNRKATIKWIDEKVDASTADASATAADKAKTATPIKGLVTNKSCEDLNLKKLEDLKPIDTHKNPAKQTGIKRAIKPFNIDVNKLTGLKNFTELSPNPLALPPYALPPSASSGPSS